MSIPDKAVEAARAAAVERWQTGSADTTQMLLCVSAGLEAAEPYLTDGLRQELKNLREYCGKYVDDPDLSEEGQLAYDDVCISIAQILQRHPEVKS